MTTESAAVETEKTADVLVGRLFEATIGMMDVISVHLGDRLGLYRALHEGGPATAGELARRAKIDPRYALEWLEQQAATGFLEVDDVAAAAEARRFSLPDAYADPLLNLDSPFSIAPLPRSAVACAKVMPQLLEAYRTGGGVAWSDYGPDMIESQGDFNRPWLRRLIRHGVAAGDPGHPRAVGRGPAGARRGCRLRRRLGGDRDRAGLPQGARRRLRSR